MMLTIVKTNHLLQMRDELRTSPQTVSIGFIPTMGNLHSGHLQLIKEGCRHHTHLFVSIFVNPKQFAPNEDFKQYPRTLDQDLEQISNLLSTPEGKDKKIYVYAPQSNEEIFPVGHSTTISVGDITQKFCGRFRPTHFDGVTTVVYRLLSFVDPDVTYLGQKDFQQVKIIEKMVHDLRLPGRIKMVSTVRDPLGLALSSRNQYLSEKERKEALTLYQSLNNLVMMIGGQSWGQVKIQVEKFIGQMQEDPRWDYLAVCRQKDLSPPLDSDQQNLVALGAFRLGKTRLIDNLLIT